MLYFLLLTIFLYLPSCVHSSPKRGRFRSGLWRGGEAAPAPVEYRSAVPGGLLKAAWRKGLTPCAGCELARPGLRRGRVRERLKARRRRAFPHGPAEGDGERRSGGEILSALREVGFRPRRQTGATLRAGLDGTPAPGTKDTPPERDGATSVPAKGGATFPRGIGGVTAPMPVGPFAPESKTGVPKIAERGAPGRHLSLTKASTARRSAPPVFICRTPRAKAAGTRDLRVDPANSASRIGPPAPRPHREEPCGFAWRLERRGFQRGQKPGPPRPRPSRRRPKRACSSG